jgi:hypothetical protein
MSGDGSAVYMPSWWRRWQGGGAASEEGGGDVALPMLTEDNYDAWVVEIKIFMHSLLVSLCTLNSFFLFNLI